MDNERKFKSLIVSIFTLSAVTLVSACDVFDTDSGARFTDFGGTATGEALQRTFEAQRTATEAPRQTWTAEANATLTALPANETATGVAMGATETAAAVATEQLFTGEAETVAANLTGTTVALARGTATPTTTATATASATATPTATATATATSTLTPTSTASPTATPSPSPSPMPPAVQVPPLALTNPLEYLQQAEDAKWAVAYQVETRGETWTGAVISQTVYFDGMNLYQNFGNGAEAWILPDQGYVLRQNGQVQRAGADVAAQAMERTRNGWRDGITDGSMACEMGTWEGQAAVACRYTRDSTFAGEATFNRLVVYIDPETSRPLAVTNTFNPTSNPNTTGSGTTRYVYTAPPPIVPPP